MAGGVEKRRSPRVRRRLKIIFEHDPGTGAFTNNLSQDGVCIASDFVTAPGEEVSAAVELPNGRQANFEAVVVWARKVRGSLDKKSTMGLDFVIPPGEDYNTFIRESLVNSRSETSMSPAVQQRTPTAAAKPAVQQRTRPPTGFTPAAVGDAHQPVAPPPTAREVRRPTASIPIAVAFPAPPIGLSGRVNVVIQEGDLAARAPFCSGVSPAAAAAWCEQAAVRCLLDIVPAGTTTVGVSTQVRVRHEPPVTAGGTLVAIAKVIEAADERTATLEVRIESLGRLIAAGQHVRVLIPRPEK